MEEKEDSDTASTFERAESRVRERNSVSREGCIPNGAHVGSALPNY